jgi:hypothetical protein
MKVRDVIKLIESDGWYLDRTRGSHVNSSITLSAVSSRSLEARCGGSSGYSAKYFEASAVREMKVQLR